MSEINVMKTVAEGFARIRQLIKDGPVRGLYESAEPLLASLLHGIEMPEPPPMLLSAANSTKEDYEANWNHQLWYHLGELIRVLEGRKERAEAQGGDFWANQPKPEPETELRNQLREIAKLSALMKTSPEFVRNRRGEVFFEDGNLDRLGSWEYPERLAIERDDEKGLCWQGQDPGGDWFWLTESLPDEPISIRFELYPVSTLKGGLIAAFCVKPLDPATPLRTASSPRMSDYYRNFDAYHFSVHRGLSGYCNLRRCGPGLIMLSSFPDPCPDCGRWYEIEIVKAGPQVELRVDGKLAVCYVDLGFIAPALAGGYFGLRHFQGFKGWHRNVCITLLKR